MTDARKLWTQGSTAPAHVDAKEIAARADQLRRALFWSNGKEYVAGALLIPVLLAEAFFGYMHLPPLARAGSGVSAVGCTFVLAYLWLKGGRGAEELPWDRSTLTAYRTLLQRRRDLLASVPRWYIGPFVPGFVLYIVGLSMDERATRGWPAIALTAAICIAVGVGIAWVNRAAARKLDAQLAALPPEDAAHALRGSTPKP